MAAIRQPINRIGHDKLADKLYEELLGWVIQDAVAIGTKLPSEADLAKQFGVSRPVVREALRHLRSDGVIISRHGSGSYVQKRPKKAFFDFAPIGGIADLMRCYEYRIALEGEAASLAARRRTTADLKTINDALRALDEALASREAAADSDTRFHKAIATATRNELFVSTMEMLSKQMLAGMTIALNLSLQLSRARLELIHAEHLAIIRAIEAQNPVAARDAMRIHILNARNRILSDSVEP